MRGSMYEAMASLYVIAGPNGAGKTTFIKRFAPRHLMEQPKVGMSISRNFSQP
jgi:ABC-type multidrug transport system ATPase subunit